MAWYRTRAGWIVVAVYAVLTVVGVAVSAGLLVGDGFFQTPAVGSPQVPWYIYLYGLLGALAYAFTSLLAHLDDPRGDRRRLVRIGLRVFAALPLSGGVYLLASLLSLPTDPGRVVAGLAFLVGLYVSLTLKALGGLADRLYGVAGSGSGDRAAEPTPEREPGAESGAGTGDGAGTPGATRSR